MRSPVTSPAAGVPVNTWLRYSGLVLSVMPCSGRSIATTTKPARARPSATAKTLVRFCVMPCWKITTGQPPAGLVWPLWALGTVTITGTFCTEAVLASSAGKQPVVLALGLSTTPLTVAPMAKAPQGTWPRNFTVVSGLAGSACQ